MKLVTDLRFSQNGITIVFTEIPKEGRPSMYSFAVDGDNDMTEKLLKSVRHTKVPFESIQRCAEALFVIIEEGIFVELASAEEIKTLYRSFEERFDKSPIFAIKDLSSPGRPLFRVTIINGDRPATDYGEGRTRRQAKFETLKKFLSN